MLYGGKVTPPGGLVPSPLPGGLVPSPLPGGLVPSPLPGGLVPSPLPGGLVPSPPGVDVLSSVVSSDVELVSSGELMALKLESSFTSSLASLLELFWLNVSVPSSS